MDNKPPFETGPFPTAIGHISATIGGDARYTDTLRVTYDQTAKRARVVVTDSSAVMGRDGPGGSYEPRVVLDEWSEPEPTPKQLLALVRRGLGASHTSFQRYGKPTRRFTWRTLDGDKRGLSLACAKEALDYARWEPAPPDERLL